ncbi:Uncharacterised protein [Shigella sonnei]|nr:Uncharacterised protein [Shigella sonnei]
MLVDVIQHHYRVIHGPERRNKAAVGQQGFLDPQRLHAVGHQIHPDTPGDCTGHIPDQLVECPQILRGQGNGDHTVPELTGRGIPALSPAGRTGIFGQMRLPYCRCTVALQLAADFPSHFMDIHQANQQAIRIMCQSLLQRVQ